MISYKGKAVHLRAIKAYVGVNVLVIHVLHLGNRRRLWSVSRLRYFYSRAHRIGNWVGFRAGVEALKMEKFVPMTGKQTRFLGRSTHSI